MIKIRQKFSLLVNDDLTSGPIILKLAAFSAPLLLGNFLQQLYSTIDLIIIGRFAGRSAFAAVGSTGYIIVLLIGLLVGLAGGIAVNVAQLKGAGNYRGLSLMIHTAYALAFIAGVVLTCFGLLTARFWLRLTQVPPEIFAGAERYLDYTFIGLIPGIVYNCGAAILQALGDSRRPLLLLFLCSVINFILDMLFVAFFHWGIDGAALATVLSQLISAIILTVHLLHVTADYRLYWRKIHIDKQSLQAIVKIGVPASLQATVLNVSNIYIQTMLNTFGVVAVAACTAVTKIDGFFCLYFNALGTATMTYVGQNYGAKLSRRVVVGVRTMAAFGVISGMCLCALSTWYRFSLLRIFTDDQVILDVAGRLFVAYIPYFFLLAAMEIYSGSLRGLGNAVLPMTIYILGICVFRCLYVFTALRIDNTLSTLFAVYPFSWIITAAALFLAYNLRKRRLLRELQ